MKTESKIADISQVVVWGNNSHTIYPDVRNAIIGSKRVSDIVTSQWIKNDFIPTVQNRSVEIIKLRKLSAAASAGKAAVDQMRDWVFGSEEWQSLALYNDSSNNSYRQIPSDIVISLPRRHQSGNH